MGGADVIRALAAAGADLNQRMDRTNQRRTPVHLAVVNKQFAALTALIDLGADVNLEDAVGLTPLDQAALDGQAEMARLLIDAGAAITQLPSRGTCRFRMVVIRVPTTCTTGQFLMGKPFVEVNRMNGFDDQGRPVRIPGKVVSSEKILILPGNGTNWYPPSYSPSTGLFYIPSWERGTVGGVMPRPTPGYGAVRAIDPKTGDKLWEFRMNDAVFTAGVLTTASDLLFTGVWGDSYSEPAATRLVDGYFYALNARTGELLWKMSLTGSVQSGPMSYSVGGKQYIAVAAGNTLFAFALRQ